MGSSVRSQTLSVSAVTPATKPLPEFPYPQAVSLYLDGPIESCSQYHGRLIPSWSNPLLGAVHEAFVDHRPLVLSPDIIWLTITQGLAIHINENSENLRKHFVAHEGKLKITVSRDDFVKGTPENPWAEVFSEFSSKIRDHIGDAHGLIVSDFSTTGPVERAASEVTLLDSMKAYFDYEMHTFCGIPEITLEGDTGDWESLEERVGRFERFGLSWWVKPLRKTLSQFVRASKGNVDRSFWESIYKYHGAKGSGTSPFITGWITNLFPYYVDSQGRYYESTMIGPRAAGKHPNPDAIPNRTGSAPFLWDYQPHGERYEMEFLGGIIGVAQDPDSLALRPEIGWAVREAGGKPLSPERRQERFYQAYKSLEKESENDPRDE